MSRFLPILCLLFLCVASCDQPVAVKFRKPRWQDSFFRDKSRYHAFRNSTIDSIETYFDKNFCGTVLIYRNGHLYRRAFGFRDAKRHHRIQMDDVFQLASASKPITAVAVMQLVQSGRIALDTPVCRYLPEFPYTDVSVRHLLNHRSGLANYLYYTDTFWKQHDKAMNNADFYRFMCTCRPASYLAPDVSFGYCNTNFALLAVLVTRISGMDFPLYVNEHIFKPAGMVNSFYYGHKPGRIKAEVLTGRFDFYEYTELYPPDGVLGDKSLYSTADDLFMLHKALSEGRLLKPEMLAMMQVPSFGPNVFGGSYGLGFRLMETANGRWTYHNGWWRGFWTAFWNRFDKKTCIVVLTNNKHSSHVDKKGLAELMGNAWISDNTFTKK